MFLKKHPQIGEENEIFWMKDGAEDIGYEIVCCKNNIVEICSLQLFTPDLNENMWAVDALMRAAVSYGVNHGAVYALCKILEIKDFLRSRGFQEKDGQMIIPTSRIVKICKD